MDIEVWLFKGVKDEKMVVGERVKRCFNLECYKDVFLKLMVMGFTSNVIELCI